MASIAQQWKQINQPEGETPSASFAARCASLIRRERRLFCLRSRFRAAIKKAVDAPPKLW